MLNEKSYSGLEYLRELIEYPISGQGYIHDKHTIHSSVHWLFLELYLIYPCDCSTENVFYDFSLSLERR